ncbi:MAG: hypothetical protein JSS87_04250 [Acidobacteria bacterium]|nr:hypothetical protein [Acidobacteriota bacterium]
MSRRTINRGATLPADLDAIVPAQREELFPVALSAAVIAFLSFLVCATRGWLLLYGDAVAHLGIARRILDSRWPGLAQLGGVWLPLPHLLMVPFVQKMEWWQNGTAGSWPSLACYILSVIACNRVARYILPVRWAFVATAFFALNPNLLYLSTTAMTEPLFLALLLWTVSVIFDTQAALVANRSGRANLYILLCGVLIFLMVFTRYDGWIFGVAVWCVMLYCVLQAKAETRHRAIVPFVLFTVICIAGPLLWFWYNAHFFGDWLDFMRGPYSAAAIEKRTSPPGSKHYRGWHNPAWALLFYTRTAQVDAAMWETGFAVMAAALAGAWMLLKQKVSRIALLLWVPLPFYVYSIAWGSVPIFIPQLYPHSFYNSRYGMELLPALALCAAVPLFWLEKRLRINRPKLAAWMHPIALIFVAANLVVMIWMKPLVFREAVVNSSTRIPFERAIANQLTRLPQGMPILMETSDHIGALQQAGIPLKQVYGSGDAEAMTSPASTVGMVVAFAGDAVSKAVAAHPQGLTETLVLCHTGQPCARFYQSDIYKSH